MKTTMMQVIETAYGLGGFDETVFDHEIGDHVQKRPSLEGIHAYVKSTPGSAYIVQFGINYFHAYPKPGGLWDVSLGRTRKYGITDAEAVKTIISSAWFANIKAAIKAIQPCA